ncbi:hypothetical protein B0I08_106150 [Glaciihabitans tibetensis]|uniref:Tfp pilus assembly protein PilO n=1 Tax=Glaciihabitans tibetensis TaxID=1266600 RepID=A0A2T0VBN4_9MICO|nr:hypothetical protein [Glaciihabitans tibetensis]PRY67543.1 hypothetical protein B0I08_106150 [Glaciihabitans tibetensis]
MPITRLPAKRLPTKRLPAQRLPNPRMPLIITTVSCCGILALGWFLGVSPQVDAAAASHTALASTELQNAKHRTTLLALIEQHARIDAIRAETLSLRGEIPAGLGLPDLVDEMTAVAAAHGVVITRYGAEEPLSPISLAEAAQASVAPTTEPTGEQPAAPTAGQPTAPAAESIAESAATAPSPRVTAGNLYAVPITLTLSGTPADARAMVGELQHGRRLFLVTSADFVATEPLEESVSEVRGYAYVLIDAATG